LVWGDARGWERILAGMGVGALLSKTFESHLSRVYEG
jgi:hypothetical protein